MRLSMEQRILRRLPYSWLCWLELNMIAFRDWLGEEDEPLRDRLREDEPR